jgi:hypothetical protein
MSGGAGIGVVAVRTEVVAAGSSAELASVRTPTKATVTTRPTVALRPLADADAESFSSTY